MALEHDNAPRFTLDQRDEILNLAARLKVQHEATVGTDDLVREAEAAGIDARFVYEATVRLGRKSRPTSSLRGPIFAFSLLAIQAAGWMVDGHHRSMLGWGSAGFAQVIAGAAVALLLSLWAARTKPVRRYVPLVALGTWTIVGLATFVFESQFVRQGYWWVTDSALRFGLFETFAACVAVFARNAAEWKPAGSRSFRLHEEEKA